MVTKLKIRQGSQETDVRHEKDTSLQCDDLKNLCFYTLYQIVLFMSIKN